MFNRSLIVVPVDGSPETERTVRYAVSIAKRRGADVHVIQVVDRRSGTLWRAPESERRLRARLRALRPAAEQEGVSVRIVTLRGEPRQRHSCVCGTQRGEPGRGGTSLRIVSPVAQQQCRESSEPIVARPSSRRTGPG